MRSALASAIMLRVANFSSQQFVLHQFPAARLAGEDRIPCLLCGSLQRTQQWLETPPAALFLPLEWDTLTPNARMVQRLWRMLPLTIQLPHLFHLPKHVLTIAPYYLSAVILHTNYAGGHYTALTRPSGQGVWYWCDDLHVVREGSIWLEFPDRTRIVQGRPVLIVHTSGDPLPSPPSLAPEAAQIAAASSTLQPAKQPANPPHSQNAAKATNPHTGRNPTTVPPFPSLVTLPPPPLSGSARWLNTHQTPARTLNDELISPIPLAKRIAVLAVMIHSVGKEVGHSARRAAGKW